MSSRIALLLLCALVGCSAARPYDPFRAPRDEIRAIDAIALLFKLELPVEDPKATIARFESLITAKLTAAGIRVVASEETQILWDRAVDQVGGYFDPKTGQPDMDKRSAVAEHVRRELRATHRADALLLCELLPVEAPFKGTIATWNGVTQEVSAGGFWNALALYDRAGRVPAASLYASLQTIDSRPLYSNAGGIQLLATIDDGQLVEVPRNEILTSPERAARAVDLALGPLLEARASGR